MAAYYNEHDKFAAAWLRELIKDGLITDGEVDERSIEDVIPADLDGFERCHFFAGIGVWDYALNQAGWPDNRRVWTGSCPCQPFSAAGKGAGFDDERHLWPAWFHLINAYRYRFGHIPTIFGEQVASKDGLIWLDTVQTDLEAIGYATATIDFPSAGVGAPHIRQRLYFVADSEHAGYDRPERLKAVANSHKPGKRISQRDRADRVLDNATGSRFESERQRTESEARNETRMRGPQRGCSDSILVNTVEQGLQGYAGNERDGNEPGRLGTNAIRPVTATGEPGLTNGFWRDAEWIYCRDEKWRPIAPEPEIFPLAPSVAGRVGLLRGAGNSINAEAAKAFIESYLETI